MMMSLSRSAAGAALVATTLACGTAHAGLQGNQVLVDYFLESLSVPESAGTAVPVANGVVEFGPYTVLGTLLSPSFDLGTIDIEDGPTSSLLTITFGPDYLPCSALLPCAFDGLRISNLSLSGGFAGFTATVTALTTAGPAPLADLTSVLPSIDTGGSLWLDFKHLAIGAGDVYQLSLTAPAPVPEPGAWMLMLAGLCGLAYGARCKRA